MPDTDEDEFTALYDANLPRIDLVGKGANGVPRFLIAKQDASAGLLEPDFVRGLIAKAPQDTMEGPVTGTSTRERAVTPNGITLNGSPADIASFIHKAAIAAREQDSDGVTKADMSTKDLNDLPDSAFAYIEPGGKKDDEGKTTPRSKRHFAIHDKAHADNAAARIAQGAKFGDEALPKVKAAQKQFGEKPVSKEAGVPDAVAKDLMDAAGDATSLDGGMDGMDPTVPLAAPEDEDVPGDPTDPGSPAWEAIDAATAAKWLSIAARLKNALGILAERELLEAASADPDDAENAWDLQDAQCAVDYVISTLAVFAAGEQAEADLGGECMEAIGKAMAGFDLAPLDAFEGLAAVRKAGRVLSQSNEKAIRDAVDSLQAVLASLPQAPVAKQAKEGGTMPTLTIRQPAPAPGDAPVAKSGTPEEQARDTGPVQAGGTTGMGQPRATGPAEALPADGPQAALPGDMAGRTVIKALRGALKVAVYDRDRQLVHVPASRIYDGIVKADEADGDAKTTMQAVFDEKGNLVGIVDPADITPVSGASSGKDDGDGEMQPGPAAAAAGDMTPQPSASAGTPAGEVEKATAATGALVTSPITDDVLKSVAEQAAMTVLESSRAALEASQAAHAEAVAKAAADRADLEQQIGVLKGRLETVEAMPAAPGVFANGQVPPEGTLPPRQQLRGQDQGTAPGQVDVAKALERKRELYQAPDARQQDAIAKSMQGDAIAALSAIHSGRPVPMPAPAATAAGA